MSSNQPQFKNDGSLQPANFGDDALITLSPNREEKLLNMFNFIPDDARPNFDQLFGIYVKEEVELSHKSHEATSMRGNLELRISNIISPLWTGDHIEGIGGTPVTVTLIDSCTKEEVKSGTEASGKVEIVVIEEDGGNEFECKLVCYKEGKKYVYKNSLPLKLLEGTTVFPRVSFAHTSNWMKMSTIRLQARFVDTFDGAHVKEAQTEPFLLKDRRTKQTAGSHVSLLGSDNWAVNKKQPMPSLDDSVWQLSEIAIKGKLIERLIEAKIETMGDFIVCLFLRPQCLKKIFDAAKLAKSFKPTVEHARKCSAILKYHSSFDQKTEVVFNVSGEVLGWYQGELFLSDDTLSETEKEVAKKLVISAFNNWRDVTPTNEDQFLAHCIHLLEKNMLHDGQDPNPQFLPEFLGTRYDEIYRRFEGLCTSTPLEPEKDGSWKRLRKLFCVLVFIKVSSPKTSVDDSHAHKKRRIS